MGLDDQARHIVAAQGDPASLNAAIGEVTKVAIGNRDAGVTSCWGKYDPAVDTLQGDWDAGPKLDGLEQRVSASVI
ncbi:hypothetical protein [Bellilinea sp.]|uniref:hypothetical protein n=1 Tax=Bellilinea sp. TaxID=2838785 RepID=UPI002ADD6234|nr:hypothetical protein [Bellilinea sp.]